jgi:hypothetical protein
MSILHVACLLFMHRWAVTFRMCNACRLMRRVLHEVDERLKIARRNKQWEAFGDLEDFSKEAKAAIDMPMKSLGDKTMTRVQECFDILSPKYAITLTWKCAVTAKLADEFDAACKWNEWSHAVFGYCSEELSKTWTPNVASFAYLEFPAPGLLQDHFLRMWTATVCNDRLVAKVVDIPSSC